MGIRALGQNPSAVIARASRGEVVTVTLRGRPAAQIISLPSGGLEGLERSGRLRRPLRNLADLPAPELVRPLSPALTKLRDQERY